MAKAEDAGAQMDAAGGGMSFGDDGGVGGSEEEKKAIEELTKAMAEAKAARQARERELAAVTVPSEAVALVESELGVPTASALHLLREHGGDVKAALRAVVRGEASLPGYSA